MSRGFACALIGIAITVFGWVAPGVLLPGGWPMAPGFAALHLAFGRNGADYLELPYAAKAATLVVLLVINVGVWALAAFGVISVARRIR